MPVTIASLPPEVLLQILSSLDPFELENTAKTLNRRIYNVVLPLLTPIIPWMRNAQKIASIFPAGGCASGDPPSQANGIRPLVRGQRDELDCDECRHVGLDPERGPYKYTGVPDLRFMGLDGSFHWLQPLDEATALEMQPHTGTEGDRPMAKPWQFAVLIGQARELGLTLPPGFHEFFTSNRLHHRIPSFSAWYFEPGRLVKCPSAVDNGAGGYLLRFHWDQQDCGFAYLYMNPSGNHCVVSTFVDIYEGTSHDVPQGDDAANPEVFKCGDIELQNNDFTLVGLSLEEYLVSVYFEELLHFEAPPSAAMKDYFAHVFQPNS